MLLLSFAIRAPNHGGAQAALHSRNRYRANLFRGFQVLAGVWLCGWGLDETVRRTLKKKKRKRIEESFGWLKTIARMRKVRRWGDSHGRVFTFAAAAYNLVRMRNLLSPAVRSALVGGRCVQNRQMAKRDPLKYLPTSNSYVVWLACLRIGNTAAG